MCIAGIGTAFFGLVYLAIVVFLLAGMWKTYVKAGQPGWGCLIPVYNVYLMLTMAGKPGWWLILWMFVPVANLIVAILTFIALAERFGKSSGFGLGLAFLGPVFFAILGFGDAQYMAAAASVPPIAPVESKPPPPMG